MRVYLATGITIGLSLYTADRDEWVAESFDRRVEKSRDFKISNYIPIHNLEATYSKKCRRKFTKVYNLKFSALVESFWLVEFSKNVEQVHYLTSDCPRVLRLHVSRA